MQLYSRANKGDNQTFSHVDMPVQNLGFSHLKSLTLGFSKIMG